MKHIELLYPKNALTVIDDDDYDRVMALGLKWTTAGEGYAISTGRINGEQVRLHRFIMRFPLEMVDHKNRNKLDNRKENLRVCNKSQNAVNTARKKGKNRFKGVYWSRANGKWLVQIGYNLKVIYGGYFKSELEAAKAANILYSKYHGEFAVLNIIKEESEIPTA